MLGLILAIAGATQGAATTQAPAGSVARLADMPNTTIHYYDVEGEDAASINRSIAKARPSVNGRPRPASANWTISASFQRHTENQMCRIRDAEVTFAATAELPRLVNEGAISPAELTRWRQYVSGLEANELPTLIFVEQQIAEVRKAILASSCDEAKATAARVVATLKSQAAAFERERQKLLPRSEASLAGSATSTRASAKAICRDMLATGSRLNKIRLCMAPREWELLHASGQEATREIQNVPRPNKPF